MRSFSDTVQQIILAPSLGRGRTVETYLAAVSFVFGCIYLSPDAVDTSQATRDTFFTNTLGSLLAVPFFLKSYFSGYGVLGSIRDWRFSNTHRFIGAVIGVALWGWYAGKFLLIGAMGSVGFPFCSVAIFVCLRVMVLSLLRTPETTLPRQYWT